MAASYKKLFKMLIDREMKSKDLAAKNGAVRNIGHIPVFGLSDKT